MAYGNELAFCIPIELAREVAARDTANFQPDYAERGTPPEELGNYDLANMCQSVLGKDLAAVHERLIRETFDPSAKRDSRYHRYMVASTPVGERSFSPFGINNIADEDAEGIIGISIISRYFPVWTDWRYPNGGSHEPVIFNQETLDSAEQARIAIYKMFPEIAECPLAVCMNYY